MDQFTSGITLKEMAKRLGLTPRAVSQALRTDGSGTTRVAPKTVARVRALAAEGGYRLNTSARALRTRRFRQAGILVRYNFENRMLPMAGIPAIFGLGDHLNTKGWHLVIVQDNDSTSGEAVPHYIREHSLDGFVLVSHGREADDHRAFELTDCGVPYVWFNNNYPTNAAGIKDDVGAELATQHLVELGHQRIIFVSGGGVHCSLPERERGYLRVMNSYGLEPVLWRFKHTTETGFDYRERQAALGAQLREVIDDLMPRHRPTGLVCYSDFEALTVNRALLTAGFKVPDDVSVVGYNDLPNTDNVYPPLTTVRADFYHLGRIAGEMLMELLESPRKELESRLICPQLIIRRSTGPAPRATLKNINIPLDLPREPGLGSTN